MTGAERISSVAMPPPVSLGDGLVFACQGDIFALDAADGSLRHRYGPPRGAHDVTAHDNRLYVATNCLSEHTVQALAVDDGAVLWRFSDEGRIQGPPIIAHEVVYASIVEGAVVALRAGDGSPLWRYETGPILCAAPAVAGDHLYISAAVNQPTQPNVVALDATSGIARWTAPLPESSPYPLAVADGVVYAATHTSCAALGGADGSLRWKIDLNTLVSERHTYASVSSAPVVRDDSVYLSYAEDRFLFLRHDGKRRPERRGAAFVVALRARDGAVRWRSQIGAETAVTRPTPLATLDDLLFVGYEGSLYALDLADGSIRWRFQTGASVLSAPVAAQETVYVGASNGYVYALAAHDGALRWRAFTSKSVTIATGVQIRSVSVGPVQNSSAP